MAKTLAVIYRPKKFEDVSEQKNVIGILKNQLESHECKNAYLFCGGAGTGKTTCARIFANELNGGKGVPIEIDGASNNGVENVRGIIEQAKYLPLEGQYKVYIIDECFCGNTKITTANGQKNISDVKVGDIVQHMTGFDKVSYVYKNSVLTNNLCCVKIKGKKIITTKDHLFFTDKGWITAGYLKRGDCLYAPTQMSELWKNIQQQEENGKVLLSSLFGGMEKKELYPKVKESELRNLRKRISDKELRENEDVFKGLQSATNIRVGKKDNAVILWTNTFQTIIRKDEIKKSDAQIGECSKDDRNEKVSRELEYLDWGTGWKWEVHNSADSAMASIREHLGVGISDKNKLQDRGTSVSYLLQSRPCLSKNENCNRGGWQRTSLEKYIIERQKEIGTFEPIRVESVEIFKRGHNEGLFSDSFTVEELNKERVTMYDLEVENDHTYFADGVLVHNCHMLSIGAWNAMLKLLEEPPARTIFIFCTTDAQKIPATILSRVQKYDFQRISTDGIVARLRYICNAEKLVADDSALEFLAKIAQGGMRDAISLMDKCFSYDKNLTVKSVTDALGLVSYDKLFELLAYMADGKRAEALDLTDSLYQNGADIKQFLKSFITFLIDLAIYKSTKRFLITRIPQVYKQDIEAAVARFETDDLLDIVDDAFKVQSLIKNDPAPLPIVQAFILKNTSGVQK